MRSAPPSVRGLILYVQLCKGGVHAVHLTSEDMEHKDICLSEKLRIPHYHVKHAYY